MPRLVTCLFVRFFVVFGSSGPVDVSSNELMGNIGEVKGRDVVIVDELIDTGGTLAALPLRLKKAGAMVRRARGDQRPGFLIYPPVHLKNVVHEGRLFLGQKDRYCRVTHTRASVQIPRSWCFAQS